MRVFLLSAVTAAVMAAGADPAAAQSETGSAGAGLQAVEAAGPAHPSAVVVDFFCDPLSHPGLSLQGAALPRVDWFFEPPAFGGDAPGTLAALYDGSLDAGLFGFALPETWTEADTFTAAAVFVLDPDLFEADPFGFFQISWGLWSSVSTGLDRTGSLADFAADSFDVVAFDYFPNISPDFGGPFLSPSVLGAANIDDPLFPFIGAFTNFTVSLAEVDLPKGVPLAVILEHRPDDDVLVLTAHRVLDGGRLLPLPGAVTVVPLDQLGLREYSVDTLGLTLWHDGFGGPTPAVRARVFYHRLVAVPGIVENPRDLLRGGEGRRHCRGRD